MPSWLRWAFWVSPLTYAEVGLTVNEFFTPRWQKVIIYLFVTQIYLLITFLDFKIAHALLQMFISNTTLGNLVLSNHGLVFKSYSYWISVGAILGFALIFNVGFILALTFRKCKFSFVKLSYIYIYISFFQLRIMLDFQLLGSLILLFLVRSSVR